MNTLVSVVHSPPSAGGERGQGYFIMFANRAGKRSGGLRRFVLRVQGLFSLLTESQEDFQAACELSSAGQAGELAQQHRAGSINLGLHSNLTGHI